MSGTPVAGFQKRLNASAPYFLPEAQGGEVVRGVLVDFMPERFSEPQSGGTEENLEHLFPSLRASRNGLHCFAGMDRLQSFTSGRSMNSWFHVLGWISSPFSLTADATKMRSRN
jgi:hypothetical protein